MHEAHVPGSTHDVIATDRLARRPGRVPDHGREAEVLTRVADALAGQPQNLLQQLVQALVECGLAETAGVSLCEPEGERFRWTALAGPLAHFRGGGTPCVDSPCNVVMQTNAAVLAIQPARAYASTAVEPAIEEMLIVPFHAHGEAVGTLWMGSHAPGRAFDGEDLRFLTRLSRFASASYLLTEALHSARTEEAAARAVLEADLVGMRRLHALNERLAGDPERDAALDEILAAACALAGADMGCIYLREEGDHDMHVAACWDALDAHRGEAHASHLPLARLAVASGQRLVIEDARQWCGDTAEQGALVRAAQWRAALFTPIVNREGVALGVLGTQYLRPYRPTVEQLRLLDLVVWTAGDFIERQRVVAALRRNDARRAFLFSLSDALRPLDDAGQIQSTAARLLAEHIGLDRCGYGEVDESGQIVTIHGDYCAPGMASFAGSHRIDDFGPWIGAQLRDGQTIAIADAGASAAVPEPAQRATWADASIAASAAAPLIKGGHLRAVLFAHQRLPRAWSADEILLLEQTAERTWAAAERAYAEHALREHEAQLQGFARASSDVLWIRNAETLAWEYLSPAFEPIHGISVADALARPAWERWLATVLEADVDHVRECVGQVRQGRTASFEYRIRRPDGTVRWLRDNDFPIPGADGRVTRIGGIGRDITEAKASHERLQASEERLRNAVAVGRLGLWDWNLASGEMHWSDMHAGAEGRAGTEVGAGFSGWLSRIHPQDRAAVEEAFTTARNRHEEYASEFRILMPDDSLRWLQARGRFFYDAQGQATRMVGATVDTTERRQWEDQQKVLVGELQHRTRNLMAVVRSVASRTARGSEDLGDFLHRFQDRLEALSRVQGLLSRLNEHDRVMFDELLRSELAAMEGDPARIRLSGPKDIRLRSSSVQAVAMALHELATNAIKYGALGQPSGLLVVTWQLEYPEPDGPPWLQIDWRESGVAMPPPSAMPHGGGQGRELIERALPYQIGAKTSLTLTADGVHCAMRIPVSRSMTPGQGTEAGASSAWPGPADDGAGHGAP